MTQQSQQAPAEGAMRTMRRDVVSASRRARARRLFSPADCSLTDQVSALVIFSVMAGGTLDYRVAEGLPHDVKRRALLDIRRELNERLEQMQEGA